jgi:hypothetical protein
VAFLLLNNLPPHRSGVLTVLLMDKIMADNADVIDKPFSMSYVLKTTSKHIRKSIDISIRKTTERIEEFANDKEKSQEVFETLSMLHMQRKALDDFQLAHREKFKDK